MSLALASSVYDVVWTSLVALFLIVFGIFETWAFIDGKPNQDTLSGHVWKWIGTRRGWKSWWRAPLRVGVLLLFLWLAEHFAFGWF